MTRFDKSRWSDAWRQCRGGSITSYSKNKHHCFLQLLQGICSRGINYRLDWNQPHVRLKILLHLSNCMFHSILFPLLPNSWVGHPCKRDPEPNFIWLNKGNKCRMYRWTESSWRRALVCEDPFRSREVGLTVSTTFSVKFRLKPENSIPICMREWYRKWAMIVEWVQRLPKRPVSSPNTFGYWTWAMPTTLWAFFFTQNQTKSCKIHIWAKFADVLGVLQVKVQQKTFNQFVTVRSLSPFVFWHF